MRTPPLGTILLLVAACLVAAAGPTAAISFADASGAGLSGTGGQAAPTDGNSSISVSVRSGPRVDAADLRTRAAVLAAVERGRLPPTDVVARSDPLVIEIRHERLTADLAGDDPTRRFFDLVATPGLNLTVTQTNALSEVPPRAIVPDPSTTTVVTDEATDTTYVVVDTDRAPVRSRYETEEPLKLHDGQRYAVRLDVGNRSLTGGEPQQTATDWFALRVRSATVRLDDEVRRRVYVSPEPNVTIDGTTNARAGLDLTMVVRGRDDPATGRNESFRLSKTARTANETGEETTFAATLDFTGVPRNTTATVDVRYDGRSILAENASVVVASPRAAVSVRAFDERRAGQFSALRLDGYLSRGGFFVLHRGSAQGPVLGVSDYLDRGRHENVTVYVGHPVTESGRVVAVARRDAGFNYWFDGADVDRRYPNDDASYLTAYTVTNDSTVASVRDSLATSVRNSTVASAADSTGPGLPVVAVGSLVLFVLAVGLVVLGRR